VTATRFRLPWGQWIDSGCRCDARAPCLEHFHELDWRARTTALARAGVQPSGR
jgi:hypothetical protein